MNLNALFKIGKGRVLGAFSCLSLIVTLPLSASTLSVYTTDDFGPGSLREALTYAQNNDTIAFDNNLNGTIFLNDILPIISKDLTIQGNGYVSIDGQSTYPIFFVNSGKVSISNLYLSNGKSQGGDGGSSHAGNGGGGLGAGGGVFVNSKAIVTLSQVIFDSNSAQGGAGGSLQSIYNIGAGGGGGGGLLYGNGGSGNFNFSEGSGGGGGGGLASIGGAGYIAGGGGGGFQGIFNEIVINGNGSDAGIDGGGGGDGFGGINTGGNGGISNSSLINGQAGDQFLGGGGGGGGSTTSDFAGNGGDAGAIGGGGGGSGGVIGGIGGFGNRYGGGGGGGGSVMFDGANGSTGGFGGGGGGGGGGSLWTLNGGIGGDGGFGGGGGGGGQNANGGTSLHQTGGNGGMDLGGGGGGAGFGGAVFVAEGGTLTVCDCAFFGNNTVAGAGGQGATPGSKAGDDIYSMKSTCLYFNSNNQSMQEVIDGEGTVTKNGQADLLLISNAGFEGQINVEAGNLMLQGDFHEAKIDVKDLGILTTTGILGAITNNGNVNTGPLFGVLKLQKDYIQERQGELAIKIDPSGNNDQVITFGKAVLNGTLSIYPQPGRYSRGRRFVIINADNGVESYFRSLSIKTNSRFYADVKYNYGTVELVITKNVYVK